MLSICNNLAIFNLLNSKNKFLKTYRLKKLFFSDFSK